jgi:hypothetical protein
MDSLGRDRQNTGDLVVRQSAKIVQVDNLAFGFRELVQCFVNLFPPAMVVVHRRDRLRLDGHSVGLRSRHSARRSPANCPQPLGKSLGISQRIQPATRNRKCLLCGILGEMLVGQAAASYSHRHTVVTLIQFAKTVDVTRAGRFYEFRIRALQPRSFPCPRQTLHQFHTVS